MRTKQKLALYAIAGAIGLSLFGASSASAHGLFGLGAWNASPEEIATRQSTMFQKEATLLGVTVEEVKNAWADGKTLQELATEKGITKEQLQAKVKEIALADAKKQLQSLVSAGVISQTQADKRLAMMQTAPQKGKRGGFGGVHFGF